MRDILEVLLLVAILGLGAYALTQIVTPPTTCQQVLK